MKIVDIAEHVKVYMNDGQPRSEATVAIGLLGVIPPEVAARYWRDKRTRRSTLPPLETQIQDGTVELVHAAFQNLALHGIVEQVSGDVPMARESNGARLGPRGRAISAGDRMWCVVDARTLAFARALREREAKG